VTSDEQSVERLRDYLRNLKPDARATLLGQLERSLLRGDNNDAGSEFVLQELRRSIRDASQRVPRIGDAARLFFTPLEPFLFNGRADHKRIGRVARASLEPMWKWIGRDLMPAEAKALSTDINRALLAGDRAKAEQVVRALHDRAILHLRELVASVGTDDRARRRLAIQVGTPRAIADVTTMLRILELRDVLPELTRRLPSTLRPFEREVVDQVMSQLNAAAATKPPDGAAASASDLIQLGLVIVLNRLPSVWQIIRIATRAAASDEPARIAETPYGVAVSIVLSELDNTVDEMRAEFKAGRPITSMLKLLHDAARGLRSEIDLTTDSAWSRQLTAIRSEVSNLLRTEIDLTPGVVRRLLRPRPMSEITPGALVNPADVDEAAARLDFVNSCRHYAGELALSEVTLRAHSELSNYLESGTKVLVDSLRYAGDDDRPFRQSQVEAAIRLCRTLFGADYAGLMAKAADVAVQAAGNERAAARA
jgi:hypothetical protein